MRIRFKFTHKPKSSERGGRAPKYPSTVRVRKVRLGRVLQAVVLVPHYHQHASGLIHESLPFTPPHRQAQLLRSSKTPRVLLRTAAGVWSAPYLFAHWLAQTIAHSWRWVCEWPWFLPDWWAWFYHKLRATASAEEQLLLLKLKSKRLGIKHELTTSTLCLHY